VSSFEELVLKKQITENDSIERAMQSVQNLISKANALKHSSPIAKLFRQLLNIRGEETLKFETGLTKGLVFNILRHRRTFLNCYSKRLLDGSIEESYGPNVCSLAALLKVFKLHYSDVIHIAYMVL